MARANLQERCVIADDTRAIREQLCQWLSEYGFDCTLAANGEEAFCSAQKLVPSLIVTDIDMPVMSGLDLVRMIRQSEIERLRNVNILVITSLEDVQLAEIVFHAGASAMLAKPVSKDLFFGAIEQMAMKTVAPDDRFSNDTPTLLAEEELTPKFQISPRLRQIWRSWRNST